MAWPLKTLQSQMIKKKSNMKATVQILDVLRAERTQRWVTKRKPFGGGITCSLSNTSLVKFSKIHMCTATITALDIILNLN